MSVKLIMRLDNRLSFAEVKAQMADSLCTVLRRLQGTLAQTSCGTLTAARKKGGRCKCSHFRDEGDMSSAGKLTFLPYYGEN